MEASQTQNSTKDRSSLNTKEIIADIWTSLNLPHEALNSCCLNLTGSGASLPSSFKVGAFAQATIGLSALAAALVHTQRNQRASVPCVSVDLGHAVTEFRSERYLRVDGQPIAMMEWPIGGLHRVRDGWVRIHDGLPHHRTIALRILGLDETATREEVDAALLHWQGEELEERGMRDGCVIVKLRSFAEWDVTEQAQAQAAVGDEPLRVHPLPSLSSWNPLKQTVIPERRLAAGNDKCLRGIRVLDFSRVIAAPVAGRVLAAHGADVLWVTAPHLPDLPACDRDTARGKRSIQLDLRCNADKKVLLELVRDADVVLQGYRPEALAKLGLGWKDCVAVNPNIVYASLSAWGSEGPWKHRRGFDSIVQAASGINVAEAAALGEAAASIVLPCQALDHGSGYLLATGICAALYKREISGGAWAVDACLAKTGRYLRSLGQLIGINGFDCLEPSDEEIADYLETKISGFGMMTAVKHSATVQGVEIGWDFMPEPLGSDEARWLRKTGCDI
jgi:crotonobetainyl-CoA:carnitine CoA-transferase CaiB-like acyl-CoA transferase